MRNDETMIALSQQRARARVEQVWLMREALCWYRGERGATKDDRRPPTTRSSSKPRQVLQQVCFLFLKLLTLVQCI